MKLILGSQSKNRQQVLKDAGYDFEVMSADIDEKAVRGADPEQLTLVLSHAKADALLPKITEPALLITTDLVVVCNGKILEKPVDEDEARAFIKGYEHHPMETVSAIVVTNTATGKRAAGTDTARVFFRSIPENAIDEALKVGKIMLCAGAMRCEEPPFSQYVERFEGTKDNTTGLPLILLKKLMKEAQE